MTPETETQKRIYDFLLESQFWSPSQLVQYQRSQLSQMLQFAHAKVPFYRDRLKPVMRADGDIDWDRWHEIPILKRQDLLDHRDAMLAPEIPASHGSYSDHEGYGTIGKPVTTRHNMLTHIASTAAMRRASGWHKIDYGKIIVEWMGNYEKIAAWPEGLDRGPWGPAWEERSKQGRFLVINRSTPEENALEFMVRMKPNYFSGRPRSAQALALASERLGIPIKFDSLWTFGTGAAEDTRDDCLRVFGAEIINLYASKEVYNIAHQCPTGHHYHINSEIILVEVIDDDGKPCPPGVRGHCIVTPFFNTAQPFIRYELGDQVTLGEACACGRGLPVIQSVDGRTTHLFKLPGGRTIAPSIPPPLRSLLGASGWQMAQVAPLGFEFRYLPDGKGGVPDFETFVAEVKKRTDPNAEVTFKRVDTLPLTPSGKFIEYVCELPPGA